MEEKEVRLIDANALRKDISEIVIFSGRSGQISAELRGARKVISRIEAAPTIDSEPVRHGRWVFDGQDYFCNRCNKNALCDKMTGEEVLSAVCPHCGAKMGG